MKKILSVILACAMLCGMSTVAYANEGTELISSDMDLDALPVIEEIGYHEMVDAEFVSFDADKFEVTLKDDAGEYVGILSMNTIIFDDIIKKKAKVNALMSNMTLQEYIAYLIKEDCNKSPMIKRG